MMVRNQSSGASIASALVLGVASAAIGQWTGDPMVPVTIVDGPGEQVQPKFAPTSDGGGYVSWFDSGPGGYDVYMQRIDASGVNQWASGGVLIADRGFSSTQDYDLSIDSAGHAVIVFRDDRSGGVVITAQRVSPAGALQWGAGVSFGNGTDFVAAPKITGATDGGVIVGWTNESEARFERVDAAGMTTWAATAVIADPGGGSVTLSDLNASDSGSAIAMVVQQAGFFSPSQLRMQKFDAMGAAQWAGASVPVYDTGSLQIANFPTFVADGAGGAAVAWYDTSGAFLQCYAQRMDSTGARLWGVDGAAVSTNAARERVSPSVAFDASTGETFVAWTELSNAQNDSGIYAQKFDAAGAHQWTDDGAMLTPSDSLREDFARVLATSGGPIVQYIVTNGIGDDSVVAQGLDGAGASQWTASMATTMTDKSRPLFARSASGFNIGVWQDGDTGSAGVAAQRLNDDGTITPVCPGDADGNGAVNFDDLNLVLFNWSQNVTPGTNGDVTGDGVVDFDDLNLVLAEWQNIC